LEEFKMLVEWWCFWAAGSAFVSRAGHVFLGVCL
jgi:hypothetical protein